LDTQETGFQLSGRALHVLVVDDNRDAADSLCILLRQWGFDCQVAYDGAAGLRAACDYQPDCLLLDITMPGLDGYTLARKVRTLPSLNRTKLIALTAYSDEAYVRRSREAGFDLHLVKPTEPLEIKRLMDMLSKVVQLAGKTEEMARQNVAVATETKELIKEVKDDMKEVKADIKEIKEDVRELKEEVREVKEARAEENPVDEKSPKPEPAG
jgi:CheY-like chemotaxis protein